MKGEGGHLPQMMRVPFKGLEMLLNTLYYMMFSIGTYKMVLRIVTTIFTYQTSSLSCETFSMNWMLVPVYCKVSLFAL